MHLGKYCDPAFRFSGLRGFSAVGLTRAPQRGGRRLASSLGGLLVPLILVFSPGWGNAFEIADDVGIEGVRLSSPSSDSLMMSETGALEMLGMDAGTFPSIPEIPTEAHLANPSLLREALKGYRDLVGFSDQMRATLEEGVGELRDPNGSLPSRFPSQVPAEISGLSGLPGAGTSVEGALEEARVRLERTRAFAVEMVAMLEFLMRAEGHYSASGETLVFQQSLDDSTYRGFRSRLDRLTRELNAVQSL